MVPQGHAQGLHCRTDDYGKRGRRSRSAILRELRVWRRTQLYRLLQPRDRQAGRSAIYRVRSEPAEAAGVGDRTEIGGRRRPASALLYPRRDLLAATDERANADGQQRLQRLPLRRPLARQLTPVRTTGGHFLTSGHALEVDGPYG